MILPTIPRSITTIRWRRTAVSRASGWQPLPVVLIIHDTTEADFSGLDIDDLGPIGHGGCARPCWFTTCWRWDYGGHHGAWGLVGQITHRRRRPRGCNKRETPKAQT